MKIEEEYIYNKLLNKVPKEDVKYPRTSNIDEGKKMYNTLALYEGFTLSFEDWCSLVDKIYDENDKIIPIILPKDRCNDYKVPSSAKSTWVNYKKKLAKQGIPFDEIRKIEKNTESILNSIKIATEQNDPVRGLVIGGVQSGKTTSMASLIAMASNYGWNTFIVLSGSFENLRVQTEQRLLQDLKGSSNEQLWFTFMPTEDTHRTQNLEFREGSQSRYLNVVLKNKRRLENLLDWMTDDQKVTPQMKILVIDDEADQASVNTAKEDEERKAINRLITNIVNGKNKKGKLLENPYGAMNYVAYTATPYANFLSEAPSDGDDQGLYPSSFVTVLSTPKNHFGPQQIFGAEETDFDGLSIIREINEDDKEVIKEIEKGDALILPESLKMSLGYFIAASASLRKTSFKKPITMLIHTSIKTDTHENIAYAIKNWFERSKKEVLEYAEKSWTNEKSRFNESIFKFEFPNYPLGEDTRDLLDFDIIKQEINHIINNIAARTLDSEGKVEYSSGINLSIDNSKNNRLTEDMENFRLEYPSKSDLEELNFAPVYIVVGGSTLSRGLTLEGLITTYFTRNTTMKDSLLQMGRWFGYRVNYELYPRIWLDRLTMERFKHLSNIDFELREQISEMVIRNYDFSQIGPKIRLSPRHLRMLVTAKNKQYAAVPSKYSFSDTKPQTYLFDDDIEIMNHNISVTEKFINTLGLPSETLFEKNNAVVWRGVGVDTISTLLGTFKFQETTKKLKHVDHLVEWLKEATNKGSIESWNVIMGTKGTPVLKDDNSKIMPPIESTDWDLDHVRVKKVNRTRKVESLDNVINIGALSAPGDVYKDIDKDENPKVEKMLEEKNIKTYYEVRKLLKMDRIPQLIIYRIDKDSKVKPKDKDKSLKRKDLDVSQDLIGLYMVIPGVEGESNGETYITVKIDRIEEFNDIEGEEE